MENTNLDRINEILAIIKEDLLSKDLSSTKISSWEEILAAARDQPDSFEPGLVEDVDSDSEETSSDDNDKPPQFDEPLVTLEATKSQVGNEVSDEDDDDSSDQNDEVDAFEFVRQEDKVEVLLKSALQDKEPQEQESDSDSADSDQEESEEKLIQDQVPAQAVTIALDYPEEIREDSSAPSSLESQSGPASVIIESQEVPNPDSASFILKTSEQGPLDNLPTPQEPVFEVIPGAPETSQSPILEESEQDFLGSDSEEKPDQPEDPWRSEEHTLNSSHITISYAVFCLKKKKTTSSRTQSHTV